MMEFIVTKQYSMFYNYKTAFTNTFNVIFNKNCMKNFIQF